MNYFKKKYQVTFFLSSVFTSWGYRNTVSADYIRTQQGGSGFGYTVGISSAPSTVLPMNVSFSIKEKK